MKKHLIAGIISLHALTSCQTLYFYHFPTEREMQSIQSDSLKWNYAANILVQIPVAAEAGNVYFPDATNKTKLEKTKLEIKSIFGDAYSFYLRSTTVAGGNNRMFGPKAMLYGSALRERASLTSSVARSPV
jgi:hypothetical protein